ncbi:hypothetical protein BJX65DRAFT_158039 [Aspergillus insuetus]
MPQWVLAGQGSFLSPWSPFSTLDVGLNFITAPRVYSVSCFIMAEASSGRQRSIEHNFQDYLKVLTCFMRRTRPVRIAITCSTAGFRSTVRYLWTNLFILNTFHFQGWSHIKLHSGKIENRLPRSSHVCKDLPAALILPTHTSNQALLRWKASSSLEL